MPVKESTRPDEPPIQAGLPLPMSLGLGRIG